MARRSTAPHLPGWTDHVRAREVFGCCVCGTVRFALELPRLGGESGTEPLA